MAGHAGSDGHDRARLPGGVAAKVDGAREKGGVEETGQLHSHRRLLFV